MTARGFGRWCAQYVLGRIPPESLPPLPPRAVSRPGSSIGSDAIQAVGMVLAGPFLLLYLVFCVAVVLGVLVAGLWLIKAIWSVV